VVWLHPQSGPKFFGVVNRFATWDRPNAPKSIIIKLKFDLRKGDFIDALCLHYGWTPARLPSHCVYGSDFSTSHAFSCPHGAFPTIGHNNIRDFTTSLLSEVCPA